MKDSRLKMHKYIWAWLTVFAAFVASFPIAMMRVSQTDKFTGQPLNSLTCQGETPSQRRVVQFAQCAQLDPVKQ